MAQKLPNSREAGSNVQRSEPTVSGQTKDDLQNGKAADEATRAPASVCLPEEDFKSQFAQETSQTDLSELMSDGSASAFEGTESIDSHDEDLNLRRKEEQLRNDPSGRSNY